VSPFCVDRDDLPTFSPHFFHSAAAIRRRRIVVGEKRKQYDKAYDYLRKRIRFLDYCEYRRNHLPIGELSEERLDRPSASNPKRTVRSAILHELHHEACHCGEMHLLHKMQAAAKG